MSDPATGYLNELERAVRDLPHSIAGDMVSGVREELAGLSPREAKERIAELGDPEFIAASARVEVDESPARRDAEWYTTLTAVLLLIGGIVVPVAGWVVGAALLWLSRTWRPIDKIIGTMAPPLGGLVTLWLLSMPVYSASSVSIDSGGGAADVNPQTELLLPFPVLVLTWILAAMPLVTFVCLLVRARILRR